MFLDDQPTVIHHDANTTGRDFIVGDLHGCRGMLDTLLEYAGFDASQDRLFEAYESAYHGKVITPFEKGSVPVQIERLKHMVPDGDICWLKDGRTCPFLALTDHPEGEAPEFACYLSGDFFTRIWPCQYHKGCI